MYRKQTPRNGKLHEQLSTSFTGKGNATQQSRDNQNAPM